MSFMSSYYAFERAVMQADKSVTDWLYGPYDVKKIDQFTFLYSIYPIQKYFDYKLDMRADEEYLSRYGMTYDDVHDPRKLKQTSSGASMLSASFRSVSSNVNDLYSNFSRPAKKKKK